MSQLYVSLKKTGLPSYAMPRLVRITKEYGSQHTLHNTRLILCCRIEANATFKKSKGDLVKKSWREGEGGNTDRLYWLNGSQYEKLDGKSWSAIDNGRAKL